MSLPTTSTESVADSLHELISRYTARDSSVAHLLCDKHPGDAVAFTVVADDLSSTAVTYRQMRDQSERLASAFVALGVREGDRVATLMRKSPMYVFTLLATWRIGAVHVPLFTAFAPPAIELRLKASRAAVVVCDADQYTKLQKRDHDPSETPWRILVNGAPTGLVDPPLDLARLLASHEPGIGAVALGGDAPFVQIYTSGTTGGPKGVIVPVAAIASFHAYMKYGLDLREDDVYWNAADPGWAYGLYYAIIGPLALGAHALLLTAGFDAKLTWRVLDHFQVTNFAAAPTVYRALAATGSPPLAGLALRCASSAGEPLTTDVNDWAGEALGVPVHDHYGQTETGMMINNHHHPQVRRPLRPGAMGHPLPGWSLAVIHADRDEPVPAGTPGRLAIDTAGSPLAWFAGYHEAAEATAERFSADRKWYFTGDTASVDNDGYFRFSSRDDDVILMAGYRIGPHEVESVLNSHPAVVESAVIGCPDQLRGEILEAYVVLADGSESHADLTNTLQHWVKEHHAAHSYPRVIHYVDELPKTPSGKLQRYVLREKRRETNTDKRSKHQKKARYER